MLRRELTFPGLLANVAFEDEKRQAAYGDQLQKTCSSAPFPDAVIAVGIPGCQLHTNIHDQDDPKHGLVVALATTEFYKFANSNAGAPATFIQPTVRASPAVPGPI